MAHQSKAAEDEDAGVIEEIDDAPAEEKAAPARTKVRTGFCVKSLEEADDDVGGWVGAGTFSVFEKQDYSKDIVRKGATKKSIEARLPKVKDHHGATVGQATKAWESDDGLEVEFRIYPTTAGRDLATLMKQIDTDHGPAAPVEEGSIGFSPTDGGATRNKAGGFDFTEITVWEVSPVTFGDNPYTRVGLKSADAVAELPTDELLGYAGEMLRSAVEGPAGVKALHRRRVADDRELKADQWKAVDGLLVDTLESARDLLVLKEITGRLDEKATGAQLRHTRAIIESLSELVHGRRDEGKPEPETATAIEDDGELEGEPGTESTRRGKAKAGTDDATDRAEAPLDMEFDLARKQYERMTGPLSRG